jgi:hypothetical protein
VETGRAKITLSYEAWKEGKVLPATVEVPLERAGTTGADSEKNQKP